MRTTEYYGYLYNALNRGAFVLSEGIVIYCNYYYANLMGAFSAEELVGLEWLSLYSLEDRNFLEREALPELEKQGVWNGGVRTLSAGGEVRTLEHKLKVQEDLDHLDAEEEENENAESRKPSHKVVLGFCVEVIHPTNQISTEDADLVKGAESDSDWVVGDVFTKLPFLKEIFVGVSLITISSVFSLWASVETLKETVRQQQFDIDRLSNSIHRIEDRVYTNTSQLPVRHERTQLYKTGPPLQTRLIALARLNLYQPSFTTLGIKPMGSKKIEPIIGVDSLEYLRLPISD